MKKIKWTNGEGYAMEIAGSDPYILSSITGIGAPDTNLQTVKAYRKHGTKYLGSILHSRKMTILVEVNGDTSAEVENNVMELMSVFNPVYGNGEMIYTNNKGSWKIEGAVYDGPEMVKKNRSPYHTFVTIGIYCANPEWLGIEPKQIRMTDFIGGLTFPITFPIKFAERGDGGKVEYAGGNPTPVLLDFRVKDGGTTVVNPRIENEKGEYLQLEKTITAGQRIIVNTDEKELSVTLIDVDGTESDAWGSIKGAKNTYLKLHRGENRFQFTAESGDPELYLTYTERYSGLSG